MGLTEFLAGLARMNDPNVFSPPMGNDLPSQGGITGTMYGDDTGQDSGMDSEQQPLEDTSQYPNMPSPGMPPQASAGGYPGIPQQQDSIMSNPVLNPTVTPNSTMGLGPPPNQQGGYYPGMMEQGGETPYTGTGAQASQGGGQGFDENAFYDQYMSRYQPTHEAQDYYNQLMRQYPQRNMHPSIMRRLSASFAGLSGGPRAAEEVMDEPFNKELEDWKNRMQPALQSANLERYGNINERQLESQAATRATASKKAETDRMRADETARENKAKDTARAANLGFRYYKEQHPNYVYKVDSEGYVYGINPKTNEPQYPLDPNGERIQDRLLPEAERIGQQHENKMEEGAQRGDQAMARTLAGGWKGPYTDPATNETYDYNERTGERRKSLASPNSTKPGTAKQGGGGTTSFAEAQRQRNVAMQILNTDPDARDWISFEGNRVVIDPEGNYESADEQTKEYVRHLRDMIYTESKELPIPDRDTAVPGSKTKPEGPPEDPSLRTPGTPKKFPNGTVGYWGKDKQWHTTLEGALK